MTFHKWLVGAFLTAIMLAALATNAAMFSARSFQDNLQRLAPSTNGVLDLESFEAIEQALTESEAATREVRGRLIAIEAEIAALSDQAAKADDDAARFGGIIMAFLARTEAAAGLTPEPAAAGAAMSEHLTRRLTAVGASGKLPAQDAAGLGEMMKAALSIRELEGRARDLRGQAERRRLEAATVGSAFEDANRDAMGLKAQFLGVSPISYAASLSGGDADPFAVIRNEATALKNSSPFSVTADLAQVHPQYLSILLVLLMGLLGGILYLFPAYMSRPNPVTFAELFVRMIFGMCTALAFYIVMNAAVAGFSLAPQPQTDGGAQSALNPFSVSLVGILAGVLADDIARYIHRRGTELLGGRPGAPLPASDPAANDTAAYTTPGPGAGAQGPGAAAGY